ncbi:MAG: hypothetical protein HY319_00620 [Armatimonadetes bacterium]|nr:hypothetical protein [Armatimonadota bacterium]
MLLLLLMLLLAGPGLAQQPVQGELRLGQNRVPVTVFAPDGYQRGETPPVLVTLPPGPGDASMVQANLQNYWWKEGLARGYLVVAPEIFGRSLDRDAGAFVDRLFGWLDGQFTYDRRRVALTGQSNGGIGAFYLAVARPQRFGCVLVIPGQYLGDPGDLRTLRGKPVWMLLGEQDDPERWLEPSKATFAALQSAGARAKLDVLQKQGHVPRVAPARLYDWIDAQLKPWCDRTQPRHQGVVRPSRKEPPVGRRLSSSDKTPPSGSAVGTAREKSSSAHCGARDGAGLVSVRRPEHNGPASSHPSARKREATASRNRSTSARASVASSGPNRTALAA